jgi:hypothetical protein
MVSPRCPSGYRCLWRCNSLVLAVLCAVAACGETAPPADTPPPPADALAIDVTLHRFIPPSQTSQQVVFSTEVTDATTIARVQAALLTVPLSEPDASYNCPTGLPTYDSYQFRFTEHGAFAEEATIDATDCEVWHIRTQRGTVVRLLPLDGFWTGLHKLTGVPLPVNESP